MAVSNLFHPIRSTPEIPQSNNNQPPVAVLTISMPLVHPSEIPWGYNKQPPVAVSNRFHPYFLRNLAFVDKGLETHAKKPPSWIVPVSQNMYTRSSIQYFTVFTVKSSLVCSLGVIFTLWNAFWVVWSRISWYGKVKVELLCNLTQRHPSGFRVFTSLDRFSPNTTNRLLLFAKEVERWSHKLEF